MYDGKQISFTDTEQYLSRIQATCDYIAGLELPEERSKELLRLICAQCETVRVDSYMEGIHDALHTDITSHLAQAEEQDRKRSRRTNLS